MNASSQCPHPQVAWALNQVAFEDTTINYLEVTGRCEACGKPVTFRGMPLGLSPQRPTMAVDGSEAILPFMLGDEEPTGAVIALVGSVTS